MAKGMRTVRLHRSDAGIGAAIETVAGAADGAPVAAENIDPESAARRYLNAMLGSDTEISTLHREVNDGPSEYKYLGIDKIPFTNSQHVKFRQQYHKIPIYGSLVTVELSKSNEFVSVNSSTGDPSNVDPNASLSPAEALKKVMRLAGYTGEPLNGPARLYFYYDTKLPRWRLVYIVEDVLRIKPRRKDTKDSLGALPEISDFVIDAHSGELVDELPRSQTMAEEDGTAAALDGLGTSRQFGILLETTSNLATMHDRPKNIRTHDLKFRDALFLQSQLPGPFVTNPPDPWDAGAVSAHANAQAVVDFLRDVLKRDGLDDQGGPIVSTVNCVYQNLNGSREWRNAARFRGQMIYGQRFVDGELRSYAVSLDVVAHELLHGLTENTARLEYRLESGALNESISDIYGVIVSNIHNPDVSNWNWEIGEDLSESGVPLRSMSDPARFGQPAHMNDFVVLPEEEDNGGVHTNSGIHNRAAFNVLTSTVDDGSFLFSPVEVARLYYVALVAHLSRTSNFSDCRAGVVLAAKSMFDLASDVDRKVSAINRAYDSVGIMDTGLV